MYILTQKRISCIYFGNFIPCFILFSDKYCIVYRLLANKSILGYQKEFLLHRYGGSIKN